MCNKIISNYDKIIKHLKLRIKYLERLANVLKEELDEIYDYAALTTIGEKDFKGLDQETISQELILNLKANL